MLANPMKEWVLKDTPKRLYILFYYFHILYIKKYDIEKESNSVLPVPQTSPMHRISSPIIAIFTRCLIAIPSLAVFSIALSELQTNLLRALLVPNPSLIVPVISVISLFIFPFFISVSFVQLSPFFKEYVNNVQEFYLQMI